MTFVLSSPIFNALSISFQCQPLAAMLAVCCPDPWSFLVHPCPLQSGGHGTQPVVLEYAEHLNTAHCRPLSHGATKWHSAITTVSASSLTSESLGQGNLCRHNLFFFLKLLHRPVQYRYRCPMPSNRLSVTGQPLGFCDVRLCSCCPNTALTSVMNFAHFRVLSRIATHAVWPHPCIGHASALFQFVNWNALLHAA